MLTYSTCCVVKFQMCAPNNNLGAAFEIIPYIFQFEINRKRDTELTKLRKLLEDVHLESEETAHLLKRKHQEIVVDFQEQIDQLTKSKAR